MRLLAHSKAPRVLMKLLALLMMSDIPSEYIIDSLEYFAGEHEISKASTRHGRLAVPYDLRLDAEANNWMTAKGWLVALALSLALSFNGQATTAPVCSSWVWMNRSTSGRSRTRPLGQMGINLNSSLGVREWRATAAPITGHCAGGV
eukprot:6988570-Alexandrium_andersonii.AAC.1